MIPDMRVSLSILPGLLIISLLVGCGTSGLVKDGKKAFELEQYMTAAEMLKSEYDKAQDSTAKAEKAFLLGECYRLASFPADAVPWYEDAVALGAGQEAEFQHAHILKNVERYEEAIVAFKNYIEKYPVDEERASFELKGAQMAVRWLKNRMHSMYDLFTVEELNSAQSDFSPTFYENRALIITSSRDEALGEAVYDRTHEKYTDLFISAELEDGKRDFPVPFSESKANTEHNEGTITFDSTFSEMYFTRCFSKEKNKPAHCNIYKSLRAEDGTWGEAEPMWIFGEDANVGHPCLYDHDTKMIFSGRDVRGGMGGSDLYYMERGEDGTWGAPQNVGPIINTKLDEVFPYVHSDGTLYFASNGHVNMGGIDIFLSQRVKGEWKTVDNMQAPINSGLDDYGLVFDEFEVLNQSGYYEADGYFTSNRPGGSGGDDVYKFTLRKPAYFELVVEVLEKKYEDPYDPGSNYEFVPLDEAEVILSMINEEGLLEEVEVQLSDFEGRSIFSINPETDYQVRASKDSLTSADQFKYLAKTEKVSTKEIKTYRIKITLTLEIILERVIKGRPITIENIYYNFDKWSIRSDAAQILDKLAETLKENPEYYVEMGSHTDSRGSTSYNEKLSQRRANAVVKYLASKGVSRRRLTGRGYGESELINACKDEAECSEAQHQENRRTTFTITGEDGTLKTKSRTPDSIKVDPEMIRREKQWKEEQKKTSETETAPTEAGGDEQ